MPRPLCLYCFAPLQNGRAFCSDECEEGCWLIVPTLDGEPYDPHRVPEPRAMTPAERQRRRRDKIKAERMQLAP